MGPHTAVVLEGMLKAVHWVHHTVGYRAHLDVPRLEPPPGRAPVYMDAIALASRRTRHLTGTDQWKAAIGKWTMAVSQDLSASSVGQELLFLQPEERLAYMGQVLAIKATSTLSKRVGQVARYYRWCDVARLDYFPITRAKIHGCRGALGRVKGFLEVLTFMVHVLGFDIPLDEVSDP